MEKIVLLDESALDTVVGGAYNQNAVNRLGLEVKTAKSGAQGIYVDMSYSSQSSGSYAGGSKKGWTTDANLKSIVDNYDNISISARTTSGEMKSLTKTEVSQLLS